MELEKQLELLNKPAIKTIKTKYGDIYDCVDFYKQHAFDHPLLKDHNFHPKVKPTLSRIKKNSDTSITSRSSTIWSKDGGCPSGTVPIKKITKDDLLRHRRMPPPENVKFDAQFVGSNNNSEQKGSYKSAQGRYKRAIVRTLKDPNNKFSGAGMAASLYNPRVEGEQHSACRLKIYKGSDVLQVGWRVDPTLYGDNKTRLFIHFQAGKIHCFNTLCPGFIIVNTEIPLDMSFEDSISQRGGMIWETTMYIDRDVVGNWWLLIGNNYEQIGFWPHRIFTDLAGFATNVEWGGVVYCPPNVPKPPMGSGFFPSEHFDYDAYCRSIEVSDVKGETVAIHRVITHTDNFNEYRVLFKRLKVGKKSFSFVLYGGHGGW
ncbi:hypothetical protein RND71_016714 [Anisodus tanguticus]|uniref:Neprosin PEP catalytic domain-containing protein n=1 Tax=Anisodus tanguticus TaxID=243964 RepID=A0AAE1S8W3_9SOLA|nr:hypothetical protein RND71_016714 [Anisodus tanguticus]